MSDFKEAFNQYKASLALAMVKGGESSRLPKIFDDIDMHEYLAQSMFEAGVRSVKAVETCDHQWEKFTNVRGSWSGILYKVESKQCKLCREIKNDGNCTTNQTG